MADDDGSIFEKNEKKSMRFELPTNAYVEAQGIIKAAGYDNQHQWFKDMIEATRRQREEMTDGQMTEKEIVAAIQRQAMGGGSQSQTDPMDQMINQMIKMYQLRMLSEMMNGGSNRSASGYDPVEESRRQERELMRQDRARQEARDQMNMMLMLEKLGGGKKDDGTEKMVQMMMQQMREDRMASEQKWEEHWRRQDEIAREKQIQEQMDAMRLSNEQVQQQMIDQQERHTQELLAAQERSDDRMEQSMQALSMSRVAEQGDEFTNALEKWARVNDTIEKIAPHLGYQKPSAAKMMADLGIGRGKPQTAEKPKLSLMDGLQAATALIGEVRALVNDGLSAAAQSQIAPSPQKPIGMPSVPMGQPSVAPQIPVPPPISVKGDDTVREVEPPTDEIKLMNIQGHDIDEDLIGMKTSKGVPISLAGLQALTYQRRDNAGVGAVQICSDHGELQPCPKCPPEDRYEPPEKDLRKLQLPPTVEPEKPVEKSVREIVQGTAEPAPACSTCPTGTCPTTEGHGNCVVCGSALGEEGCEKCISDLYAIVQRYQPLVMQLHENGVDITEISRMVDLARADAEDMNYTDAGRKIEQAGQMIVREFEQLEQKQVSHQKQQMMDDTYALLTERGKLLNHYQSKGVDITEAGALYNEAISHYSRGELPDALTKSQQAMDKVLHLYDIMVAQPEPNPEPQPEPAATPEEIQYKRNPDFQLYHGVEVPEGDGPIVGIKKGPMGRIIDEQGEIYTVDTLQGQIPVKADDLKAGVCTFCGRDCKTAGGRTQHEKACELKYYEKE